MQDNLIGIKVQIVFHFLMVAITLFTGDDNAKFSSVFRMIRDRDVKK